MRHILILTIFCFLFRARTAETARWMLTKEKFGYQQSFNILNDNYDSDNEMNLFRSLSYIGSEDSVFPKSMFYSWSSKFSGLNRNKVKYILKYSWHFAAA